MIEEKVENSVHSSVKRQRKPAAIPKSWAAAVAAGFTGRCPRMKDLFAMNRLFNIGVRSKISGRYIPT